MKNVTIRSPEFFDEVPEKEKHKKSEFKWTKAMITRLMFCILLIIISFVFMVFSFLSNIGDIHTNQSKIKSANVELKTINIQNDELQKSLDQQNYDKYIEKVAREKGYIYPDETVYYDLS